MPGPQAIGNAQEDLSLQFLEQPWTSHEGVQARLRRATTQEKQQEKDRLSSWSVWLGRNCWKYGATAINTAHWLWSRDLIAVMRPWVGLEGPYAYTSYLPGRVSVGVYHPAAMKAILAHLRHVPDDPVAPLAENEGVNERPLPIFLKTYLGVKANEVILHADPHQHAKLRDALLDYIPPNLNQLRADICDIAKEHVANWVNAANLSTTGTININKAARLYTASVVAKLFTGLPGPYTDICDAVDVVLHHLTEISLKQQAKDPAKIEKAVKTILDAIDLAMKDPNGENLANVLVSKGLTENEVRGMFFLLVLGGHETTATGVTYTLWMLANNPDLQNGIVEELSRHEGNPANARSLKTLKEAIRASLEYCPPAWGIGRMPADDLILEVEENGELYQKYIHAEETIGIIPIFAAEIYGPRHNNSQQGLLSFSWFPFGGGPTACPGQELALSEIAIVAATLLKTNVLSTTRTTPPDLAGAFVTSVKTQIQVGLAARV